MSKFVPKYIFKSVNSITPQFLSDIGVSALALDLDDTLALHGSMAPAQGVLQWLDHMRESGIKLILVSNNKHKRVAPFAKALGLQFVHFSTKPLSRGLRKAMHMLGVQKHNFAIVGDQIFTDIWGGNSFGITAIMVEPLGKRTIASVKLKRALERPFIKKYYDKGGKLL